MALFIYYPKCGTCQKAAKWLKENNVDIISRNIIEDVPSITELTRWVSMSDKSVAKFFNTSGKAYKEGNIKEKVKTQNDDELIKLLSTNGMLIKRPILVTENIVLIGFKEDEWSDKLTKK